MITKLICRRALPEKGLVNNHSTCVIKGEGSCFHETVDSGHACATYTFLEHPPYFGKKKPQNNKMKQVLKGRIPSLKEYSARPVEDRVN